MVNWLMLNLAIAPGQVMQNHYGDLYTGYPLIKISKNCKLVKYQSTLEHLLLQDLAVYFSSRAIARKRVRKFSQILSRQSRTARTGENAHQTPSLFDVFA